MEYLTPNFTKDMMKDYTVLVPNMAPIQFSVLKAAMESEGYAHVELLGTGSSSVSQLGLKYVHNDTCYPALIVIGQFLDALDSGKYDPHKTALVISQSGGGCRASNYIKLLRKALVKSGYDYVPVASANVSGLESGSVMPFTWKMIVKILVGLFYGDLLSSLRNQCRPYEIHAGDTEAMLKKWIDTITDWFEKDRNYYVHSVRHVFDMIVKDFAGIPVNRTPKVKVGIVGEIYVKFSPTGNNGLLDFLESQDCEVNLPGIMGYVMYCCANWNLDYKLYGMSKKTGMAAGAGLKILDSVQKSMNRALEKYGFSASGSFKELMKKPEGIMSLGMKMGEGWLLTAEMIELIEGGYPNIVCAQPFGCLPNHIAGKGVINKLREKFPQANITAVDYDPGATRVNQENRIKLMLAVARENMTNQL